MQDLWVYPEAQRISCFYAGLDFAAIFLATDALCRRLQSANASGVQEILRSCLC